MFLVDGYDRGFSLCVGFFVELGSASFGGSFLDDGHHARHLFWAHDGNFCRRPNECEFSPERATTHAIVAGSIRRPDNYRDVWHRRIGHGIDHFRPVLGNATLLKVRTYDVAGDVMKKQQRHVDLIAELDKLRRFFCRLGH